jgi:RNA polymerase sigma factor (sigma-70 family)
MEGRGGEDGTTDAELLVGSIGDVARFGELYDRHLDAVLAYFLRRTGCPQTAADLTSETFAQAFTSRHRFQDLGAPARAWLFTIARRQLARYMRHERVATRARRRLGVEPVVFDQDDLAQIERHVDLGSMRAALVEAVAALPRAQADAVRLRIVDDLTYAEVASRLGCSEAAARVRVCRGLTRLGELIGDPP